MKAAPPDKPPVLPSAMPPALPPSPRSISRDTLLPFHNQMFPPPASRPAHSPAPRPTRTTLMSPCVKLDAQPPVTTITGAIFPSIHHRRRQQRIGVKQRGITQYSHSRRNCKLHRRSLIRIRHDQPNTRPGQPLRIHRRRVQRRRIRTRLRRKTRCNRRVRKIIQPTDIRDQRSNIRRQHRIRRIRKPVRTARELKIIQLHAERGLDLRRRSTHHHKIPSRRRIRHLQTLCL